jgi:hypothetical protein
MHFYLTDSVTSRGGVIRLGGMRGADRVAEANQIQNLFLRLHKLLLEALDLDLLGLVLQDFQCLMIIQQVIEFAPVDLVHGNGNSEIPLVVLEVSDAPVKQVSYCQLLKTLHCKGLTGTSLAISEYCDYTLVEGQVQNRLDRVLVELII